MSCGKSQLALVEQPFDRVLAPWEKKQYQPISWWEMLQFSARMFFWCGDSLRHIKEDCLIGSIPGTGDEPTFNLSRELDDKAIQNALPKLKRVEEEFRKVGMNITADTVQELAASIQKQSALHNFQWLMDQITNIQGLANKEMKDKVFLYIPPERAKFWPRMNNQNIFGDEVDNAFPSAIFDVSESGICLALARGSACVFHLMRVLEIGLTVLGAKFGVSLAHTNWAPAIEQIESKIRGMHTNPAWKSLPDCKEQQEFYAQAASHFGILKDAWRNYTMHARGFYTEEQAERIFENVKGFMQKLAERLHE
jgi:hypothetical protein